MQNARFSIVAVTQLFFFATSCTWDQAVPTIDCTISPVILTLEETQDTNCGVANGVVTVSASGGEAPYEFTASGASNATGIFTQLGAGTITVTATDAKGCVAEIDVTIQNQSGVNLDNVEFTEAGCGSNSGTVQVTASGGTEPYQYRINSGSAQESNQFSGLNRGTHTVTVIDQAGCESSESVKILSGISYESAIKDIITTNCAISGCHAGNVSPDLRVFSNIQARASAIKTRTGNKSMPQGRSLTQSQIDMIACWVDDGAQSN